MSEIHRLCCKYSFVPSRLIFISLSILAIGLICGCNGGGGGGGGSVPPSAVTENKLNLEILDATISPDRRPVVTFRLTDDKGNPIGTDDVSMNWIISRIERGRSEYFDYITRVQTSPTTGQSAVQANSESSLEGSFQNLGNGLFTYTFNFVLPENFDSNITHTVGVYATKDIGSKTYVSNATFNFVPAGGQVSTVRDIVRAETCNTCHDPLAIHGGSRRDPKLCILCHTTEIVDPASGEIVEQLDPGTGNNIGFEIMIHKIHYAEELSSVQAGIPYEFEAFMDRVVDFSNVVFPQDARNCTKCHTGGTQSDNFKTDPSRAVCGSCHDDVNFESGENHGGGIQLSDNNCSGCHLPSTDDEFDLSVVGSHTIPLKSVQVPGVNFNIIKVESAETGNSRVARGEHLKVTFKITNDAGEGISPSDLNSLRFTLSGSTTDYSIQDYNDDGEKTPGEEYFLQEDVGEDSVPDGPGNFLYTFVASVPPNAIGTYTVGIEGYKCATVQGASQRRGGINCDGTLDPNGNGQEDPGEVFNQVRDAGQNVVFDFPVTDGDSLPRRMVVENALCSNCHGVFSKDFSVHGNIRNNTEYCVLCHNPSADDIETRPIPAAGETAHTTSINFRVMLHKIHTGENLTKKPYIIFGFRGSLNDFSEVLFPGDTGNCEACHLHGTQILNPGQGILGEGILASTEREFIGEDKTITKTFLTSPIISVCTSCHDNLGVNEAGNSLTGENHLGGPQSESACIDCHIAGEPLGVEEVHLPPLPPEKRIIRPQ